MTNTTENILIEGVVDAVRDTLRFAIEENDLLLTTSPVAVREMADGSGRWAAFGCFCEGDDFHEVHTRRIAGAFNEVEILTRGPA